MANWYYYEAGKRQGPVSAEQLKNMALEARITPETVIESSEGRRALASAVAGLTFGTAPGAAPASSQPAVPPNYEIPTATEYVSPSYGERAGEASELPFEPNRRTGRRNGKRKGGKLAIPPEFFQMSALYCTIAQWVIWGMYCFFYYRVVYLFVNTFLDYSRADNQFQQAITFTILDFYFTYVLIPVTVGGFLLFILMPLIVSVVKLLGKMNEYLDIQLENANEKSN